MINDASATSLKVLPMSHHGQEPLRIQNSTTLCQLTKASPHCANCSQPIRSVLSEAVNSQIRAALLSWRSWTALHEILTGRSGAWNC